MHEVLVNRLGGLSLPRKSVVRLTDRPDMTLDVYRGRKTTIQLRKFEDITLSVITSAVTIIQSSNFTRFKNYRIYSAIRRGFHLSRVGPRSAIGRTPDL